MRILLTLSMFLTLFNNSLFAFVCHNCNSECEKSSRYCLDCGFPTTLEFGEENNRIQSNTSKFYDNTFKTNMKLSVFTNQNDEKIFMNSNMRDHPTRATIEGGHFFVVIKSENNSFLVKSLPFEGSPEVSGWALESDLIQRSNFNPYHLDHHTMMIAARPSVSPEPAPAIPDKIAVYTTNSDMFLYSKRGVSENLLKNNFIFHSERTCLTSGWKFQVLAHQGSSALIESLDPRKLSGWVTESELPKHSNWTN